jgi:hypothetical protein
MRCRLVGLFQRAAIGEISGDPGRPALSGSRLLLMKGISTCGRTQGLCLECLAGLRVSANRGSPR